MGKRRQQRALQNELKRTRQALQEAEEQTLNKRRQRRALQNELKRTRQALQEAEEQIWQAESATQEAQELAAAKEKEAKKAIQQKNEMSARLSNSWKKISWECNVDGAWIPYQPDISTLIEKAYIDIDKAQFSMGGWAYEIDFTRNQQQQHNLQTGVERHVRRQETFLPALSVTQPTQIVWEFQLKKNWIQYSWIQYSPQISQILESNWKNKSTARFQHLDSFYEIDMNKKDLQQVDLDCTKNRQNVRRRDIAQVFPDTWNQHLDVRKCHFITVEKNTTEWSTIDQELKRTLPTVSLLKVERVQNHALLEYYNFQQKLISRLSRDSDPNVKKVWHGTRVNDPRKICADQADGFMMQCSNGGRWGFGLYFAENASYSDAFAYCETKRTSFFHSTTKTKTLILVNLIVGEEKYLEADDTLVRCPDKEDGTGRYDTVTGTTKGCKCYVVYENGRAYPAYLVSYV